MRLKVGPWQSYAGLMTMLFIYGLRHFEPTVRNFAETGLALIALVGLWGYATGEGFLMPRFWKVVFVLVAFKLANAVALGLWAVGKAGSGPGAIAAGEWVVLTGLAYVPMLLALFRYGYRGERFWNGAPAAAASQ